MHTTDYYDAFFMQQALSLAKKGWGKTGTNPLVGAVVVKNNRIVGQGFHRKLGEAHAEVSALVDAANRAHGATLYVNLEPCCYVGHTPPCVEAIRKAKIKRVVIGTVDPNPMVNGQGIEYLKNHNIDVTTNVLAEQAHRLNLWYEKYITTKIPYVILKIATSQDGKISGFSEKYITSKPSRRYVHSIRSRVGAVLVGINTVLTDDPFLTDRLIGRHNPARVVIDPHLKIPMESHFLKPDAQRIIITSSSNKPEKLKKLKEQGCEFVYLTGDYYPVKTVLQKLGAFNIGSVLVEGGAIVFSQFFGKDLYDELFIFVAPRTVGKGIQILDQISRKIRLKDLAPEKIGEDLLYHVYRNN
jgi:diaminohydroxyphosphoribosylaminopyrimidine deaminase/5-amino-6-(5-phosphoribosylamino)uracil reductase